MYFDKVFMRPAARRPHRHHLLLFATAPRLRRLVQNVSELRPYPSILFILCILEPSFHFVDFAILGVTRCYRAKTIRYQSFAICNAKVTSRRRNKVQAPVKGHSLRFKCFSLFNHPLYAVNAYKRFITALRYPILITFACMHLHTINRYSYFIYVLYDIF
jgi:hypothetical protein